MKADRPLHGLVRAAAYADHRRFFARLGAIRETQDKLLTEAVTANVDTVFGREHDFKSIRTYADFAVRVPVGDYEDFRPYIDRIAASDERQLTVEAVRLFEPTSGSSGAAKLIPYTDGLRRQFSRAVNVWLYDLYQNYPRIRSGRHFWSITPPPAAVAAAAIPAAVKTGFDDDADYLGAAGAVLRRLFVLPPDIKRLSSMEDYYAAASACLLAAGDLSLVSVWNPSAWDILLQKLVQYADIGLRALRDGELRLPSGAAAPSGVRAVFNRGDGGLFGSDRRGDRSRAAVDRARFAAAVLDRFQADGDRSRLYQALWPDLTLISAWGDAESRPDFERLGELFPAAARQMKGLLATEAIMSFPLELAGGNVAAYTSHFMEFFLAADGAPTGRRERGLALRELADGERYFIVLTTASGFYRYSIGDIVTVDGCFRGLPRLRFLSRDAVCDLVGEKLHEAFARTAINSALRRAGLAPIFRLLAPERTERPPRYILYIENADPDADSEAGPNTEPNAETGYLEAAASRETALSGYLEAALAENYHYAYARSLGQLGAVRVFVADPGAHAAYLHRLVGEGLRLGDIKAPLLERRGAWATIFGGRFADAPCNAD